VCWNKSCSKLRGVYENIAAKLQTTAIMYLVNKQIDKLRYSNAVWLRKQASVILLDQNPHKIFNLAKHEKIFLSWIFDEGNG